MLLGLTCACLSVLKHTTLHTPAVKQILGNIPYPPICLGYRGWGQRKAKGAASEKPLNELSGTTHTPLDLYLKEYINIHHRINTSYLQFLHLRKEITGKFVQKYVQPS